VVPLVKDQETEVKLKVSDPALSTVLPHKIRQLGGAYLRNRTETNVILDTATKKLRKKKQVLRIRHSISVTHGMVGEMEVTFKDKAKKSDGISSRTELTAEVETDQAKNLEAVLNSLGYKNDFLYEKKRSSYALRGCIVEFDTVPFLGEFIEIEGADNKAIEEVIGLLDLKSLKRCDGSYIKLLKDHMKKNKIKGNEARFSLEDK
jgi:predicted adenylyl cyclase CyaB